MARSALDREIKKIKEDLKSMGELVQKNLSDAIKALENRDETLSLKVAKIDNEKIDKLYTEIEERCIMSIALHQPVAGDLRFISTAMNATTNLERIGDYAKDVAMVVPFIKNEKPIEEAEKNIQEMAAIAGRMTKDAIDSFIGNDKKKVKKVMEDEEKVDSLYGAVFSKLKEKKDPAAYNATLALNLLLVARCLERTGDHAVNISHRTMYVIEGAWKYV